MLKGFTDTWVYRGYCLDTPAEKCGQFAPFVEYWRGHFGSDGELPAWSGFSPESMMHWWGRLSLLRYQDEPFDIHCDLFGTKTSEWFGEDMTNSWLSSDERYRIWWPQERQYYEKLQGGDLIGLSAGGIAIRGRYSTSVCSVELPIRNSHGTLSLFSFYIEVGKDDIPTLDADPVFEFSAVY